MNDKPDLFGNMKTEKKSDMPLSHLTNDQLHYLCKRMSGLGAPNTIDDTGWCKDTWDDGNRLAELSSFTTDDAKQAGQILYKFADTQLPYLGANAQPPFIVNSSNMWATRQILKLSIIRYSDNFGNRIALMGWFNADANKELRSTLKFPKIKFETQDKITGWPDGNDSKGAWSIQDTPDVIAESIKVLAKYDIDFMPHMDWNDEDNYTTDEPIVETAPDKIKVDSRYQATVNIDSVELKWPFLPNNADIRAAIKQVDGWKWDGEKKVWRVPLAQASKVAELVRPHSKQLADAIISQPEIANALGSTLERVMLSQATEAPVLVVDDIKDRLAGKFPDGLDLYPFQYVGVAFVEAAEGRAMIGDEMGIGKTIQAIAYSVLHTELWPVLVVAPANVKYNWGNEIAKWVPDASVCVIKDGKSTIEDANYTVINYDLMAKRKDDLLAMGYNLVILDESHYIKNDKAQRTIATISLAQQSKGLICLTGTPITNRPDEFFTQLNLLRPNKFASVWNYRKRYCDAKQTKFGWKYDGASNLSELNEQARDFMVRRLLEEVMPEMPSLVESFVPVDVSVEDQREYNDQLESWQGQYEYYIDHPPMPQGFVLNMLTALRHACGRMKINHAAEYIENYCIETGKQIVVFAHHRDVIDGIYTALATSGLSQAIIRGGVAASHRTDIVNQFQQGGIQVLLCATVAAKEGITLTNADTVLFVEREWVPGWEAQAAARIRRIGQHSEHCHQVFLSASGTIDQHFDAVVKGKAAIVKAALDGDGERRAEGSIVADLLKRIMSENQWRNV